LTSTAFHLDDIPERQTKPECCNVTSYLPRMAATNPDGVALVITRGRTRDGKAIYTRLTFADLEEQTNRYANSLLNVGITRGTRTLLMVIPGLEFIGLSFALIKIGAVPVLIDPGMGLRRLLECIRHVEPEALIGIPKAHALRILKPRAFRSVTRIITVGRRWFWGGPTLRGLVGEASGQFTVADTRHDETAAILFTSGSTGPAKGVVYEHGMFEAQVRLIQRRFGITEGEVDMPSFPLFSLFSAGMGMTCVIPDMDPAHPARVAPGRIVEAVRDHRVTSAFGSPALWDRVSRYCVKEGIVLDTLKRILISGAPVSPVVLERLHKMMGSSAEVFTPYGATESLPVASIGSREVLAQCRILSEKGAGTCVGTPFDTIEVRLITITDNPIAEWSDDLMVADGEKGEIVVAGPVVTKAYYGLPEATALAKIRDGDRLWHRIGDIGYRDTAGRIWFCGRKSHRVEKASGTMFSVPCEGIFNAHPYVYRCALVGVGPPGAKTPVIVVELQSDKSSAADSERRSIREQLLELARANELTRSIKTVLLHPSLPVDVRHNAKIDREKLAEWAAEQLR